MLPFHKAVSSDFESLNQLILKQLHSDVGLVENIGHYLIEAGGKRLRPLLVLLTARAMGYQGPRHIELATVIEFIHTATLLHDDVVDTSALRRGRPTANAEWGNAPSVLVGDFLYSRAFQMLVHLGDMKIMSILSNTTNIISEGEVQQLVNAKNPEITEANYFTVIYKKTAALFEAACETAAVLCGASAEQQMQSALFGKHLGIAFQLVDDALDYQGNAETLGKNVGDDLAEGKPTLPLIRALQCADEDHRSLIKDAIRNGGLDHLEKIINIVNSCGALDYTLKQAHHHIDTAKAALEHMPVNSYRTAMHELSDFAVARAY